MRRASQPDLLIIPNRFLSASSSSSSNNSSNGSQTSSLPSQRSSSSTTATSSSSSLLYAWSSLPHHAPLSADPVIRALSTSRQSSQVPLVHSGAPAGISPVEPAVTVSTREEGAVLLRPGLTGPVAPRYAAAAAAAGTRGLAQTGLVTPIQRRILFTV
jgi:hypothetical protein